MKTNTGRQMMYLPSHFTEDDLARRMRGIAATRQTK